MALATADNKRILLWSETPAPFDGTEGDSARMTSSASTRGFSFLTRSYMLCLAAPTSAFLFSTA